MDPGEIAVRSLGHADGVLFPTAPAEVLQQADHLHGGHIGQWLGDRRGVSENLTERLIHRVPE